MPLTPHQQRALADGQDTLPWTRMRAPGKTRVLVERNIPREGLEEPEVSSPDEEPHVAGICQIGIEHGGRLRHPLPRKTDQGVFVFTRRRGHDLLRQARGRRFSCPI